MKKRMLYLVVLLAAFFLVAQNAQASLINFDDQGLSGPDIFASAGPAQTLIITVDSVTATFGGGVILTNTTNLPADTTSVYGTADFGDATLTNPLTVTFSQAISNFFLDVYNGLTTDITYRVSDDIGNSAEFTLAPNLNGGTTQIGFATTGTTITIASITSPTTTWDFFIDNIHFDEELPPDLQVPEPATMLLLGFGLVGLAGLGRKKFFKK